MRIYPFDPPTLLAMQASVETVVVDVDEYGDEIFLDSSGFDRPSTWSTTGWRHTAALGS